jgi:hypothetical protein
MFLSASVVRRGDFLFFLVSIACWAMLSSVTHARLGETAQACVDRYGQPVNVNRGDVCSMVFRIPGPQSGNKLVTCFFDAPEPTSVCQAVTYNNFGHDLEVMEQMLELNSQGSKWLKPKITPNASLGINNYDWDREDGATAQNHGGGMYIWGKEISQRNRDDKRQGFRDRVNGL